MRTSAALLLICLWTLPVHAAEDPPAGQAAGQPASQPGGDPCLQQSKCRELYDGARRLSQAEQYEGALVMYQSAYAVQPRPWLLVNIGRIQQKLGRPEQAVATYKRFLADPTATADPAFLAKAQEYLQAAEHAAAEEQAKRLPAPVVAVAPAPAPPPAQPLYKKWWFWTAVGGAVALTAVGIGVGVGVATQTPVGVPPGVSAFYPTF